MKTLVVQSAADRRPEWMERCLSSVQSWAAHARYEYLFLGDELFDFVPDWYLAKCGDKRPVAADLARLVWMQRLLQDNVADCVIWLDADVLVFAPQLRIAPQSTCLFGYELWVQPKHGKSGFEVRGNVHNAVAAFRQDCPILPFLIEVIQRLMRRADPEHIAPQMMGPKLLSHLHNFVGFEITHAIGAVSPALHRDLTDGSGAALQAWARRVQEPLLAANLAASTAPEVAATEVEVDACLHTVIDALSLCVGGFAGATSLVKP